jgi:hypothetical protein
MSTSEVDHTYKRKAGLVVHLLYYWMVVIGVASILFLIYLHKQ